MSLLRRLVLRQDKAGNTEISDDKKVRLSLTDEDMVKAIMAGKKMEKPPNMPAYGEKGITEDQAKALVVYMKSLKQ